MQSRKIKVLIIDKRELFAEGLRRVLTDGPNIEVVGVCLSGSEAVQKAPEVQPDIVLIDTQLPRGECVETARLINKIEPKVKVLILTHSETYEDLLSAFKGGARGYVTKDITVNELVSAIAVIAEGGVLVSSQMAGKILEELATPEIAGQKKVANSGVDLSKRESEVLNLLARGANNKEIAASLFIAGNTVKVHLRNIMEKLHVHSRLEAALLAQEEKAADQIDRESG